MALTALTTRSSPAPGWTAVAGLALAVLAAGCRREQVRVYDVPKESPPTAVAEGSAATDDAGASSTPRWTLPPGWQEKPASAMRVGSFSVPGKNGRQADVSVIPLGGMPQSELDNVNRWRGLLGLAPIAADELTRQTERVKVGSAEGHLFDIVGTDAKGNGKDRARILGAILPRGDTTWFFKMSGDDATVADAKPAFIQFLRSVQFPEAPELKTASSARRPMSTNVRDIPAGNGNKPEWNIPATWQEQPASAMLIASYLVTDNHGGQAHITISSFPGPVGGALANVNRWRAQVSLPPIEAAGLGQATESLDIEGGKAMLVDVAGTDAKTGKQARLVAAMVPRNENTWFYKMLGDESAVAQERDAFVKFIRTVRYPHG